MGRVPGISSVLNGRRRIGPQKVAVDIVAAVSSLPALSKGVYSYRIDQMSRVALLAARQFLLAHRGRRPVLFVLFSNGAPGCFGRARRSQPEMACPKHGPRPGESKKLKKDRPYHS